MRRSAGSRSTPVRRSSAPLASWALLIGSLLAGFISESTAQPPVAKILVGSGPISATSAGNVTRDLASRSDVFIGDTLRLEDGQVQIRFASGLLMSLERSSSVRVDRPDATSAADSVALTLIDGGCRVITRAKPGAADHRVATPVAEVRGNAAAYRLSLCRSECSTVPRGLHIGVTSGLLAVSNAGGTLTVHAGEFAHVAADGSRPFMVPTFGSTQALPLPGVSPPELPKCDPKVFGGCA